MRNQFDLGSNLLNHNGENHWEPFSSQSFSSMSPAGFAPNTSLEESPTGPLPSSGVSRPSSTSRARMVLVGVVVGLVVLLGGGLILTQFILKSSSDVTLYQANSQNVTKYVGGGGIVFPLQQLIVTYPDSEQVLKVFVKPGDTVAVNQPLIQLDPTQLNIQIKQASDNVDAAQAYLNSVSASGSAIAIAQAQQQYNLAKSKYDALVAQTSSLMLNKGNLVSPMEGVVTEVDINPGQVFAAQTPLITLMDESSLIVHVQVPLANLGQVHIGQSAEVTPSALPNINLAGQVSSIVPQANPQTDTFQVWVTVPNPKNNLLPGMSVFVRIQINDSAVVVPRLAVLNPDRDSAVFVIRDQHVYLQRVHVAGRSADKIFIDSGLSVGEYVVLVGLYWLHNGQHVRVTGIEK